MQSVAQSSPRLAGLPGSDAKSLLICHRIGTFQALKSHSARSYLTLAHAVKRCDISSRKPRDYATARAELLSTSARFSVNENVVPWLSLLSTSTVPPMASTKCLTIERPSPVPPTSRERPASTR